MTCGTCANYKSGPMNQQGFGACALGPSYTYLPMSSTCKQHKEADARSLVKRAAFNKKWGLK